MKSFTSIPCLLALLISLARAGDPLPSWQATAPKQAIVAFVEKVSKPGSPDFVPVAERIATFDNEGTLWAEQPFYFQQYFIFDRIQALAPQHPEWTNQEPYSFVLKGDLKAAAACSDRAQMEMMQWTSAGSGPRFCLYVHHTDAAREWAYDRQSANGHFDKGLDEARAKGWTVVSMKDDWRVVYVEDKK